MTGHVLSPEDVLIVTRALDQYGARLQCAGPNGTRTEIARKGFKVYRIPDDIAKSLHWFFHWGRARRFEKNDCRWDYIQTWMDESTVNKLNAANVYFGSAPVEGQSAFVEFMQSIAPDVERELGHPWRIVNVRAWQTEPSSDFGPTAWHSDGLSSFSLKFMLYLAPMNDENGTLEICDRQGKQHTIETDYPACILFDNANLLHRGRPGKVDRLAIEVQTMPAPRTEVSYIYAGQNARVPRDFAPEIEMAIRNAAYHPKGERQPKAVRSLKRFVPLALKQAIKDFFYPRPPAPEPSIIKPVTNFAANLNIGGGLNFNHRGWINLEVEIGPNNPLSFRLTPDCVFPVRSGSIQTIYSSHCLEHLDDATVSRVLEECQRVISADGKLVIAIPDFEKVLECYQAGDSEFFKLWGIESIVDSWGTKNVDDTLENRASFIFCGWWNVAWGSHFGAGERNDPRMAYHGPVYCPQDKLKNILRNSPHQISQLLVSKPPEFDFAAFNHQNAWSRQEFCDLLNKSGFSVTRVSATTVINGNPDIPDIGVARQISAYYEAVAK